MLSFHSYASINLHMCVRHSERLLHGGNCIGLFIYIYLLLFNCCRIVSYFLLAVHWSMRRSREKCRMQNRNTWNVLFWIEFSIMHELLLLFCGKYFYLFYCCWTFNDSWTYFCWAFIWLANACLHHTRQFMCTHDIHRHRAHIHLWRLRTTRNFYEIIYIFSSVCGWIMNMKCPSYLIVILVIMSA